MQVRLMLGTKQITGPEDQVDTKEIYEWWTEPEPPLLELREYKRWPRLWLEYQHHIYITMKTQTAIPDIRQGQYKLYDKNQ